MVKQERAARTRGALVRTAASLFDLQGYVGTTLTQVTKVLGNVSAGALNFHFSSKAELAEAVVADGERATRAALDALGPYDGRPLDRVAELTLALVRLLEADASVRAAVRLERELPGVPSWTDLWLPEVDALLERARAEGGLRPSVAPETVSALVHHLVAGAEALVRRRLLDGTGEAGPPAAGPRPDGAEQFADLWRLVRPGIAPAADDR